jgi:hypothetical protein
MTASASSLSMVAIEKLDLNKSYMQSITLSESIFNSLSISDIANVIGVSSQEHICPS